MKKNILRVFLIILLFATFSIIFGFSSQNKEQSGGLSQSITEVITNQIKFIQDKSEQDKLKIVDRIESIIRKIAHFSIYTIVRNFINVAYVYI